MTLSADIKAFLASAYNPLNLATAPEKLRQACTLLERVQVEQAGGIIDNRHSLQFEPSAYTPEDAL